MKKLFLGIIGILMLTAVSGCTKAGGSENTGTDAATQAASGDELSTGNSSSGEEKTPMIVLNNKLYKLLDMQKEPANFSGTVSGQVLSSVPRTMEPRNNGQSNFGEVGSSYSFSGEDQVVVSLEDRWQRFARTKFEADDGQSYDFILTLTGTLPNAAKPSIITVLTNDEKLTFEAVTKRLLNGVYEPGGQEDFYYLEDLSDVPVSR